MSRNRAELGLVALLLGTALCSAGFVAVYAISRIPDATQYLGIALGLAFVSLAAACVLIARRLVVTEELDGSYPPVEHEAEQAEIELIVNEAGERFTRKRLVVASAGLAGAGLGAALISPVVSFGPVFDLKAFTATPWRRGTVLLGEDGHPLTVDDVEEGDFYTAYPAGANPEQLGAPIVVVRLPLSALRLPEGREAWAPHGVVAYSKICTHAGCAVSLYRKPTFPAVEPGPALVCPCHYSTFDPARGGAVLFGPAGRPLPQLPLEASADGELRAGGSFSGPVGPSWWGSRSRSSR
ncbi:MAG TPA: ubiquinol-cytochrome c reductase iron-sulfur subunit [Gaiellaceae bacterium]|jgi:ubiquinol-cytochrome c reductase iron-sulfur subunit